VGFHKGETWASTVDQAPPLVDGSFGEGWERFGDIAEPEDEFWRTVRRFNNGGSTPRTVPLWIHVDLASGIGGELLAYRDAYLAGTTEDEASPRVWLAFACWSDPSARLLVTRQRVGLGASEHRAPEVHPGRVAGPSRPLCFRITASEGLFDRLT